MYANYTRQQLTFLALQPWLRSGILGWAGWCTWFQVRFTFLYSATWRIEYSLFSSFMIIYLENHIFFFLIKYHPGKSCFLSGVPAIRTSFIRVYINAQQFYYLHPLFHNQAHVRHQGQLLLQLHLLLSDSHLPMFV